jgi:hypothetical protein
MRGMKLPLFVCALFGLASPASLCQLVFAAPISGGPPVADSPSGEPPTGGPPPGGPPGGGPVAIACVVVITRSCAEEFGNPPSQARRCSQIECVDSCQGEKGFNFITPREEYDTEKWTTYRSPIDNEQGSLRELNRAGGVRCAYVWNCKSECREVLGEGKRCQNQSSEIALAFKVIGEDQGPCENPF